MFDPAILEKTIVAILSHPAMAEVTDLASIVVSIMQARKGSGDSMRIISVQKEKTRVFPL